VAVAAAVTFELDMGELKAHAEHWATSLATAAEVSPDGHEPSDLDLGAYYKPNQVFFAGEGLRASVRIWYKLDLMVAPPAGNVAGVGVAGGVALNGAADDGHEHPLRWEGGPHLVCVLDSDCHGE